MVGLAHSQAGSDLWVRFLYGMDTQQITASLILEVSRLANLWNFVPALLVSPQLVAQAPERDI
jgi:hypothetical protein